MLVRRSGSHTWTPPSRFSDRHLFVGEILLNSILHLVSVSGGKDSTATLLLALKQFPNSTYAVFADTGNEHEMTLEYLEYLERTLGIRIKRLRADFSANFERKRNYVLTKWPEKGVSQEKCERAASLLVPSGNPFLDLCMLKGRFPSRMAQFCTERLKTEPLVEYAIDTIDLLGVDIWSWQGIRRDESAKRRNALGFEDLTGGMYAFRPIVGWTAQQTVDFVRSCGVELNPLYKLGMGRVGCMPCINANKAELAEISRRFPEHIERIAEWERIVAATCRRDDASFFAARDGDPRVARFGHRIHGVVEWSRTKHGGSEIDPFWQEDAPGCSSSYGLCDLGGVEEL